MHVCTQDPGSSDSPSPNGSLDDLDLWLLGETDGNCYQRGAPALAALAKRPMARSRHDWNGCEIPGSPGQGARVRSTGSGPRRERGAPASAGGGVSGLDAMTDAVACVYAGQPSERAQGAWVIVPGHRGWRPGGRP